MMVESQELEKEKESVIVESEETTEPAQAEALFEDEVASAPDDDSAIAPEEVEKEPVPVIVDSEETTELAQAEALLEDEVASAPDDDSATASEEVEKEPAIIVDSEETTEPEQTEALLEDEVASAPDDDSATASEEVEAGASDAASADGEESIEEEELEEEKEPERPEGVAWFVVHSYSGYENKVEKNLEHRIESMGMQDQIFQVVVPTEEEVELRDGQRRTTERRVFPGYILVEMLMNDDTWYVVRNTPGVTDFVRSGTKPIPLRQEEVDKILKRMEAEAPKIKVRFKEGQKVRIVDGPFEDFMGTVDAIDTDRARVRVLVNMFGRETPVEVDFLQVERV